jgi:hypothetical protein
MDNNKKNVDEKGIVNTLENFLSNDKSDKNVECTGDVCYVNDGKELVERIEKKLVTSDGRRLLI